MTQLQRLLIGSEQFSAGRVSLSSAQQHYLVRVLRLQVGDRFIVMNGQGQWWLAVLTELPYAKLLEPIAAQTELPVPVTLLIAMPKTGLDDVVRQATELGAARIVPVISERTILKPSPQKVDRWQRIAQEAAEQSERQIVPELSPPQRWDEVLQNWNSTDFTCYLCEARGSYPHLLKCLEAQRAKSNDRSPIVLAIGPEGGWTDLEITRAIAVGYQPVSLGFRILRAVTAPVMALSIVASVLEAMPETMPETMPEERF